MSKEDSIGLHYFSIWVYSNCTTTLHRPRYIFQL